MRFSMPRHHWAGGTLLPAVRRTPALHEQGRRQRLFLLVEQEERVCINRAQRRADATRSTLLACHAYHWTAGGCQGGIPRVSVVVQARQQRVAQKGRALMQRFRQAFASAGVRERKSRRMWTATTAAWYACPAICPGCDAQVAVWTGGDEGVAVLMRRPRVAACE